MNQGKIKLNSPLAIIAGSIIISVSILISGGVIDLKGSKESITPTPSRVDQPQARQAKTEADIVTGLRSLAVKLGLDQDRFNQCLDSGEKTALVSADLQAGFKVGVGGTPAFFVNGRPFLKGAAPFTDFKTIIEEELKNTSPAAGRKEVTIGTNPVLGNINAPVALIEFSDYQCPYCAKFYKEAESAIKKEYIDSGKVKIYYRDFPLNQIHPGAQKAAEAARCAGDQGKYWQYHDLIFENQTAIF